MVEVIVDIKLSYFSFTFNKRSLFTTPQCLASGGFAPIQCHPATLTCWCVDAKGDELPGTRLSQPRQPDCQSVRPCPPLNCSLACLHGHVMNEQGCPVCQCRDPCHQVKVRPLI